MSTLESKIEEAVVKYAKQHLLLKVTKLNVMGQRGIPDRVFWIPGGSPLLIEFKKPGKELRKLQQFTLAEFRALGYHVEWCDDEEKGKQLVREYWTRLKQTKAMESGALAIARSAVSSGTRRSGSTARSRNGKNFHDASRNKGPAKRKAD